MKKKSTSLSNMGTVSLMMIFIVLCLVTFATLSLTGSVRTYYYCQRLSQRDQEYYEASNSATNILADIDQILYDAYLQDPDSYPENALQELSKLDGITLHTDTEEPTISYQVTVSDTQVLNVILTINDKNGGYDNFYRINTWQKVSSTEWTGDDNGMNLFQP